MSKCQSIRGSKRQGKKKTALFDKITIVGVGLIGGSLGLAIKRNKLALQVVGVGHRQASIRKALKKKAIDQGTLNLKSGISQADLVILATPVNLILRFLKEISAQLKPGSIVIDVGSSKEEIIKRAQKHLSPSNPFIGCHPIAGSEKRGIEIARSNLFRGAVCIITSTEKSNRKTLDKIKKFWRSLGSKVEVLSPAEHDRLISTVSHLPHLAAAGLVLKLAQEENKRKSPCLKFIGPGFKDTTRIAASPAGIWQDICFSNRTNIIKDLKDLRRILARIEGSLKNGQKEVFLRYLEKAKKLRSTL